MTGAISQTQKRGGVLLLRKHPYVLAGLVIIFVCASLALLAPLITPDPTVMNATATMQRPGAAHWFGTDSFGRDIFARVLFGIRTTILVALAATALAALLGVTVGVAAGVFGGWTEALLMRFMDVIFAFPSILAALAIAAVTGGGLASAIITIGIVYTPQFARIARAGILETRGLAYVEAAVAIGNTNWQITRRHLLPNILSPLLVQTSLSMSLAVLLESALSFLGLGVQPPEPSLGRMLSEATSYMLLSPWAAIFPGAAISLLVMGFNFLGDGLRDWFDPRLR